MPGNVIKYMCENNHILLLQRPCPSVPEQFNCPVTNCSGKQVKEGDAVIRGLDKAHGNRSTYVRGCRCEACVKANTKYSQAKRTSDKNKQQVMKTYREQEHDKLVSYMQQGQ